VPRGKDVKPSWMPEDGTKQGFSHPSWAATLCNRHMTSPTQVQLGFLKKKALPMLPHHNSANIIIYHLEEVHGIPQVPARQRLRNVNKWGGRQTGRFIKMVCKEVHLLSEDTFRNTHISVHPFFPFSSTGPSPCVSLLFLCLPERAMLRFSLSCTL